MIWFPELTVLFLFFLARAASAYLPTALSVALRPLFPCMFKYAQVYPLKPAPFCTLFAGLGSTNKFATFFCLFAIFILHSQESELIAIFWTGRPHSLGSCHFRSIWTTCLPQKGGGVPLSALPKDTTSKLAGLFSTTSHKCGAPNREAVDTIFKSLLV